MPTVIPAENTALANLSGSAYVDLGTGLGLNMQGTAPYTFECWVYPYDGNATGTIFSQAGEYVLSLNGGRIQTMRTNQHGPLTGSTILPATTWSYVAVTYDGYTLSVYLNGNLEASQTGYDSGIGPQGGNAQLGANKGAAPLSCDISTFRAWKICLTQSDLNLFAYQPPLGPQAALYTFIDFGQVPATDRSGLGTPINYVSGAVQQITAPGLLLDGATQYAVPTNTSKLLASGAVPYTLEGWIYLKSTSGQQCIFSNQDAGGNTDVVFYVDGGVVKSQRGTAAPLASMTVLQANQWYDVATTYDGTNLTIFINGQPDSTAAAGALAAGTPGTASVGAQGGTTPSRFFNGYIQFLTFWNLALTQDQIIQILYEDPTHYPGIAANFDFSNATPNYVNPAVDLTNGAPLTLSPSSAPPGINILRTPATSAAARTPLPTRVHSRIDVAPRRDAQGEGVRGALACGTGRVAKHPGGVAPLSREHQAMVLEELERLCGAAATPEIQDALRARCRTAVEDAFRAAREDPGSLRAVRFSSQRVGDEHVLTFHLPDGTVYRTRASAVEFTPCQIWWAGFLFTLFYGLFSIYVRVPKEQLMNAIWTSMRNQATALAFEEALGAGFMGFGTVMNIGAALYNTGMLKTVLWMIASSIGWWGFMQLLVKLVEMFIMPVPTPSKAYAALMLVTVIVQLALQYNGSTTPPVPGYHQSCG